jgi:hypothetical protein
MRKSLCIASCAVSLLAYQSKLIWWSPVSAHACGLQFAGRDAPSTVISFAQKALKDGQVMSKLHVIELGSVPGA